MQKSDIVLLIMNCYNYIDKAEKQRNTWLKSLPINITYFHVIGDKIKCGEQQFVFDNKNNILFVASEDDYNSLPHKVIESFGAINKTYEYKYILKTDDDQMLIKPNFFFEFQKLILSSNSNYHYGGTPVSVKDHISMYHLIHDCLPKDLLLKQTVYCNGRFYFLSKEANQNILKSKHLIKEHFIEDHSIGLYLDDVYKGGNMLCFDSKKIFCDT